jgi:16S rRNA pseudouridine516 synthase
MMRLDKFVSHASGLARELSKRAIRGKRVSVNGEISKNAALQVGDEDKICLDDICLRLPGPRYFMLHKPAGYVCATTDGEHPVVLDLFEASDSKDLKIAGRLDIDTTGLLLLSSDGNWLHRVSSPRHQCQKIYIAALDMPVDEATIERFAAGIVLRGEDRPSAPARCIPLPDDYAEVHLHEGRYHQVKRMFAACGRHVRSLHRKQIGSLLLNEESLPVGTYRPLSQEEIESFQS